MHAGRVRLRPILMTTFALIAGMLPVAIGLGEGGEFYRPMAVAIIGGTITSTMLTLLVVPTFYDSIEIARDRAFAKFHAREARWNPFVGLRRSPLVEAILALVGDPVRPGASRRRRTRSSPGAGGPRAPRSRWRATDAGPAAGPPAERAPGIRGGVRISRQLRAPGDPSHGEDLARLSPPRLGSRASFAMSDSSRAIFLSYASQDAQAARRICDALREAGLEVWFDQSELRGGDAWDASIRTQIRECALFVPIVSASSSARSEGYFRREWNLAVTRMLDMSDDHAFLVPVVIDETTQESARVPDRFRERQWSRLPGGEPPKSFVDRVKRLLAGTGEQPPRRGPAGARSDNLPLPLDSFIGRGREVRELEGLLATAPLVTLTGAGGTGKTRLSLRVAAGLVDRFPDGVWLVELAPIADARLVPQAIASALGVKEAGGRPIAEALANHVRQRSLLLVLDNCEHLSASCAEIAKALLSASPNLKILATSREPMRVRGETTYPVLPLPAPERRGAIDADAILRSDAVRLFVDRAIAAQPAFAVTDGNAAAVAEICRHLDGLPLAIELAAARVRALSVETIAGRLGERFHLLASGDPTALPRQQTLRALIDWSHDLLTQPERMLLRRLAVFAGSWTVDAAESVASGSGIDKPDVLDLMTSLVEKSLVTHEAQGHPLPAAGDHSRVRAGAARRSGRG